MSTETVAKTLLAKAVNPQMVQAFAGLFTTDANAYATADFTKVKFDPKKKKWIPAYKTLPTKPTLEQYRAHLQGELMLTLVPIGPENHTYFGAIDDDKYGEVNFVDLWTRILNLGLPLLPERTKSGGAHLWYFGPRQQASVVRKWLLDWAIELGYPRNIEIFPKQDTLDGIDAKGSGINLPYFGALGNVAIDAKGNDIALEAFLKDAKALRKDCLDDPTAQRERAARTFQPLWSWGEHRNDYTNAITGALRRHEWGKEQVRSLVHRIGRINGDTELELTEWAKAVDNASNSYDKGEKVRGIPYLRDQLRSGTPEQRAALEKFLRICMPEDAREPIEFHACTVDELLEPVEEETYLIKGMVPTEAYTLIAGALSSYKTLLLIYLAIWRATGHNLLAGDALDDMPLEEQKLETGPSVLVTYEDTDKRIKNRLKRVAQHGYHLLKKKSPHIAKQFLSDIARNLRRVPLSGKFGKTIVYRSEGVILPNEAFVDELLAMVRSFTSEGVFIGLDPLRLAIVGSQNDDDGADVAVQMLNYMSCEIPNSAMCVCSHTTKSGAKEPGTGFAEASYATSGSALYSQHARSNFLLARLSAQEIKDQFDLREVSQEEITRQSIARLTHGRLSHGPESVEQYVRMRDGVLLPIEPLQGQTAVDVAAYTLPLVAEAIKRLAGSNTLASQTTLSHDSQLKTAIGGEKKVRAAVKMLEELGDIHYVGETSKRSAELTEQGRRRMKP